MRINAAGKWVWKRLMQDWLALVFGDADPRSCVYVCTASIWGTNLSSKIHLYMWSGSTKCYVHVSPAVQRYPIQDLGNRRRGSYSTPIWRV
jgi:hypothetical protein